MKPTIHKQWNVSFLLLSVVLVGTSGIQAENPTAIPKFCSGYRPVGTAGTFEPLTNGDCPDGWAIIGMLMPQGVPSYRIREGVSLVATCCPLPAADVLLDEEAIVPTACPESFVATGVRRNCPATTAHWDIGRECTFHLRCSKINTRRYQLSMPQEGAYWGVGSTFWKQKHRYLRRDLPVGVRYALGRIRETFWDQHGCVGQPIGSILVGKYSKRCHGHTFRQLQYNGVEGDPSAGTPVPTLPECPAVHNKFARELECVYEPAAD